MSKEKVYDNKWDDEVEIRLKPVLEAVLPFSGEERWNVFRKAFKSDKEYNDVMNLLMKARSDSFYSAMERGSLREEYLYSAWMEAIVITVKQFKVDGTKFMIKLNKNFEYCTKKEKNREQFKQTSGGMSAGSVSEEVQLGKFLKIYDAVEKSLVAAREYADDEELRQEVRARLEKLSKCTGSLLDKVEALRNLRQSSIYSDKEGDEYSILEIEEVEREGVSFGKNPENLILTGETEQERSQLLNGLIPRMKEEFALLTVELRECFRVFFTRDILVILKLKEKTQKDEVEEKHYAGSLCRYMQCPAGNKEIYDVLARNEYFLMENLLHDAYIRVAVESGKESLDELYGIYYNLLKREFTFKDKVITELLGLNEDARTRRWKKYQKFKKSIYTA